MFIQLVCFAEIIRFYFQICSQIDAHEFIHICLQMRQAEYLLRIADLEKSLELREAENATLGSNLHFATKRIDNFKRTMVLAEEELADSDADDNQISTDSSDDEETVPTEKKEMGDDSDSP